MELQFLEEDERGRRQGDAQLIGPEARTAGAPEGEGVFQFLEAILTVAAGAIHVGVDPLRRLAQIRDDETRVIARPSWLLRSSATDAACLRRPSVVVVEPAQHREGHDAPAGLYAARPLPLVRDPLPDPLVRSPPVEVSHPFGEHAA